jgi:hypothetical protein
MNIEQTKETIRVMDASINGMEVESKLIGTYDWVLDKNPSWNWLNYDYRIKPTAKLRPWTADEVPVGAILRYKGNPQSLRILIVSSLERGLAGYETNWPYQALLQEMEHSTDGGKNWLTCGVVEEAK